MVNIEHESRACRKLFAAIINRALLDACTKPTTRKNLIDNSVSEDSTKKDSMDAMGFLFGSGSALQLYLDFLDLEVSTFRMMLLRTMFEDKPPASKFVGERVIKDKQKRYFRFNYNEYQKEVERIEIGKEWLKRRRR